MNDNYKVSAIREKSLYNHHRTLHFCPSEAISLKSWKPVLAELSAGNDTDNPAGPEQPIFPLIYGTESRYALVLKRIIHACLRMLFPAKLHVFAE